MAIPPRKPQVNPSFKQRFQESPEFVSKHKALVDSDEFQRALDYTLLHYVTYVCQGSPADPSGANYLQGSACCFQRIKGIVEFIEQMKLLSETPSAPQPRPSDNLRDTN